jgi:hypothetical protein
VGLAEGVGSRLAFDLDALCAQQREKLRAEWASRMNREIGDPDSAERCQSTIHAAGS